MPPVIAIVNHKWNGMAHLPDRYIKRAKLEAMPLEIHCEGEIMTIPLEDLDKLVKFSKGPFKDNYGRTPYMVLYYWWKKDKVGKDPIKRKKALKEKKKYTTVKAYELSNKLHEQDPDEWFRKYVL